MDIAVVVIPRDGFRVRVKRRMSYACVRVPASCSRSLVGAFWSPQPSAAVYIIPRTPPSEIRPPNIIYRRRQKAAFRAGESSRQSRCVCCVCVRARVAYTCIFPRIRVRTCAYIRPSVCNSVRSITHGRRSLILIITTPPFPRRRRHSP